MKQKKDINNFLSETLKNTIKKCYENKSNIIFDICAMNQKGYIVEDMREIKEWIELCNKFDFFIYKDVIYVFDEYHDDGYRYFMYKYYNIKKNVIKE